MLEELTDIDPFNYDNWAKLAECYAEDGRMDDAFNALDYAKAINPDDVELKFLEATLLLDRQEQLDRVVSLLQQVIKDVPSHFSAKRNLSVAFMLQGKSDMATLMWQEELHKNPSDALALLELMDLDPLGVREYVERYFDTAPDASDETMLIQRVENWALTGAHERAIIMLGVYNEKFGLKEAVPLYLRELYVAGHIKDAYDFFVSQQDSGVIVAYDLTSIAVIAAIMLRMGRYSDVVKFCTGYIDQQFNVNGNPEHVLLVHGLRKVLADIRELALAPTKIPDSGFDPLQLVGIL